MRTLWPNGTLPNASNLTPCIVDKCSYVPLIYDDAEESVLPIGSEQLNPRSSAAR